MNKVENPGYKHPLYGIWNGMKQRCRDTGSKHYARYGGRGIKVDPRWLDFWTWAKDMGDRPDGYSLEREDNDGDYAPGNCKWASKREQANNTSATIILTLGGISKAMAVWARELDIDHTVLRQRIKAGWTHERALTTPVRPMKLPERYEKATLLPSMT